MEIEEKVIVRNSMGRSDLGHIVFSAARGEFADTLKSEDKAAIDRIDKMIRDAFDEFAQECFDKGREYQKSKNK